MFFFISRFLLDILKVKWVSATARPHSTEKILYLKMDLMIDLIWKPMLQKVLKMIESTI